MVKQPEAYLSYLLRLWRTGETSPWKASLEDPVTGRRLGFGNLQVLFAFLRRQTQSSVITDPKDKTDRPADCHR